MAIMQTFTGTFLVRGILTGVLLSFALQVQAADPAADAVSPLSAQAGDLKQQMIQLNRDLFILEEDLLYPASTQVAVFVSVDVGKYFNLDAIELRIDDKPVSTYLYTEREVKALHRGGMQRFYVGNIKTGKHQLTAFFTGIGPEGREYKRGASYSLEKGADPALVELRITDSTSKNQPEFSIRTWE